MTCGNLLDPAGCSRNAKTRLNREVTFSVTSGYICTLPGLFMRRAEHSLYNVFYDQGVKSYEYSGRHKRTGKYVQHSTSSEKLISRLITAALSLAVLC